MKTIKIKVLEEHINAGIQGSMSDCPIALALKEQTGKKVSVGIITTLKNGETEYYTASDRACEFMTRFDSGEFVQPTTFVFKKRYSEP